MMMQGALKLHMAMHCAWEQFEQELGGWEDLMKQCMLDSDACTPSYVSALSHVRGLAGRRMLRLSTTGASSAADEDMTDRSVGMLGTTSDASTSTWVTGMSCHEKSCRAVHCQART